MWFFSFSLQRVSPFFFLENETQCSKDLLEKAEKIKENFSVADIRNFCCKSACKVFDDFLDFRGLNDVNSSKSWWIHIMVNTRCAFSFTYSEFFKKWIIMSHISMSRAQREHNLIKGEFWHSFFLINILIFSFQLSHMFKFFS